MSVWAIAVLLASIVGTMPAGGVGLSRVVCVRSEADGFSSFVRQKGFESLRFQARAVVLEPVLVLRGGKSSAVVGVGIQASHVVGVVQQDHLSDAPSVISVTTRPTNPAAETQSGGMGTPRTPKYTSVPGDAPGAASLSGVKGTPHVPSSKKQASMCARGSGAFGGGDTPRDFLVHSSTAPAAQGDEYSLRDKERGLRQDLEKKRLQGENQDSRGMTGVSAVVGASSVASIDRGIWFEEGSYIPDEGEEGESHKPRAHVRNLGLSSVMGGRQGSTDKNDWTQASQHAHQQEGLELDGDAVMREGHRDLIVPDEFYLVEDAIRSLEGPGQQVCDCSFSFIPQS